MGFFGRYVRQTAEMNAQRGTLNIMLETEVQSLDPQVATDGTSFEVIADYTDGLMQMDADGAAVPAIAETYDISEDGKTYTFHLRDAKWSNGEAVTAADFVFGWQRAVDPATASEYSYMLSDIGQVVNAAEIIAGEKPVTDLGVTAVDDKTLEVQLNVPVSYFLSLMYFPTFYPVNEAFYNTCKDTFGTSPDTVLSNGAFKLTDYQPAATAFTLEKNPDYYDAGKIALDGLAYQVIKDSQQALMSYQTGTLDITLLNGEQVDQVKDFVDLLSKYPYEMDLVSGRYTIDAKSLLGIYSLDLSNPLTLVIYSDSCEELLTQLHALLPDCIV